MSHIDAFQLWLDYTEQVPDTRYYLPQLYRYRYRVVQIFCTENAILCVV